MQPKVLFTASTFSHILHFHLPYLRFFQQAGWTVHVACGGQAVPVAFTHEVISLPLEKKMTAPANFKAAALLRRRIKAENYTLITTHTSLAAFFTRLALKGLGNRPPVVNMVHGYLFDDDTPPLKRSLLLGAEHLTAGETDLLLTMNRWDLGAAEKYRLGRRVGFVPGIGVDFSAMSYAHSGSLRQELGISDDTFLLLYAAEFSSRKSQSVLLQAMARLPESVMLALPGSGTLLEQCKALARDLGIAHRVLFPGYITDMAPWYAAADAAVSSSRSEGLPFNIMEAMYAGLPVVASAVKGHGDLISHGQTGLLYPYGDAEACADRVSALLTDPDLRAQLSARARAEVAAYDLEQVLPAVLEQYRSVLPDPTLLPHRTLAAV